MKQCGKDLQISTKTIERAIKALVERNWVGKSSKSGVLYPRSLDTIRKIEGLEARKAFLFKSSFLKETRQFLIATSVSIYINRKEYSQRKRGQKVGGSQKRSEHFKSTSLAPIAMANIELVKYLNISLSTASDWKTEAIEAKFLVRKRIFECFPVSRSATKMDQLQLEKVNPWLRGRLVLRGKELVIQKSDRLTSKLHRSRRDKIR